MNNKLKYESKEIEYVEILNEDLIRIDESSKKKDSLNPSIVKEELTAVKGIGASVAKRLINSGIDSIDLIVKSTTEDLAQIKGIGLSMAQRLIESAKSHLKIIRLNDFSNDDESIIEVSIDNQIKEIRHKKTLLKEDLNDSFYNDVNQEEIEENLLDVDNTFEDFEHSIKKKISNTDSNFTEPIREVESINDIAGVKEIEDPGNFNLNQRLTKYTREKNSEKYNQLELESFMNNVRHCLESNKFLIIEKIPELREIYIGFDLLAFKTIQISEFLELIYILPIKLSTLKGSFVISAENIEYNPLLQDVNVNTSPLQNLTKSFIEILKKSYERISVDLLQDGKLSTFFRNYLKIDLKIEKTLTNKNLFYRSGFTQYKIVIEPILVCQNAVGFLEKVVPFAYQKQNNIHIIERARFSDFLQYFEKKYSLIETYVKSKTSIASHIETVTSLMNYVKYSSILFIIYGFTLVFLLLFQGFSILQILINLGYGMITLYSIIIGFLFTRFIRKKSEMSKEFETPYYRKDLEIDDTSLILINEELGPKLMSQFAFECMDNNTSSKIIEKIEKENAQEFLKNKIIERKANKGEFFENEDFKRGLLKKEIVEKYSSFLED